MSYTWNMIAPILPATFIAQSRGVAVGMGVANSGHPILPLEVKCLVPKKALCITRMGLEGA